MSGGIGNAAISASAGSGKTYQLTNRYIRLLHYYEKPERIAALTFTRAAAGEFFTNIINKLSDAAGDPEAARKLSGELEIEADAERYRELLRLLVSEMHRLNLQTLDSFFHRIVSAFALELGLSGQLRLLDETAAPRAQKAVCDQLIHEERRADAAMGELWQAFNQATYGSDERSVERTLTRFITDLHHLYLEAPEGRLWGGAQAIWKRGCPWDASRVDAQAAGEALLANLPDDIGAQQRKALETLARQVRDYPIEQKTSTLFKRVLEQFPAVLQGSVTLESGGGKKKRFTLTGTACEALAELTRSVVWFELGRALQTTQGAFRVLQAYDALYDRKVRRPGRLSFGDIIHLLATSAGLSPLRSLDPEDRLLLDYRLDATLDHWLLDEFQDTSRMQWSVIANLIDEVVQDSSGERSFFYVGDTKQCLYLWRNGDDRLFHEIATRYEGNLSITPLYRSWRSAPPILDAVNEVFGDDGRIAESFDPAVAERWSRAWHAHEASPATENNRGYACWLRADENEGPGEAELVLRVLRELRPLERGISVGILARSNKAVREIADYIRTNGGPPVHTGSAIQPATDNAAGAALLSLLKLAAHPGDRFALRHLEMTGLFSGEKGPPAEAADLRRHILEAGAGDAIGRAARKIASALEADDGYHRSRLDLLADAARRFDEGDETGLDRLHDYLESYGSSEVRAGEAVIIETVHKAKGLEYDCVILLENGKRSALGMDQRIQPLRGKGQVEWVLKPFKKEFMSADPALDRFRSDAEEEGGFAALCTLYVAMTRAKRGLYMISGEGRMDRGSVVKFLKEGLGGGEMVATDRALFEGDAYPVIWETGEPGWHDDFAPGEADEAPAPAETGTRARTGGIAGGTPRLRLVRPSATAGFTQSGDRFFEAGHSATATGSQVHEAFERIEWLEDGIPEAADPGIAQTLRNCFDEPAIRALFSRPSGSCEVWREKHFSIVDGENFISGSFDRVVLHRNKDGAPASADIIDFKTDRIHDDNAVETATEHHRPQLEAYRKALAAITGLEPGRIRMRLVFTGVPGLVEL